MKKLGLFVAIAAMVMTWIGGGASSPQAQEIDPTMVDGLTEAVNNHNPDAVLVHFAGGGMVVLDSAVFDVAPMTLTAGEYAARQRPNQPDVPTDIHIEAVQGSLQIGATRASWTWRETAGFLKDINVDYIDFSVVATTQDRRFKSLTIRPTMGSLVKLISLAPTQESLAMLPYSPAVPTLPFAPTAGTTAGMGQSVSAVRFASIGGSRVAAAAIVSGTGADGGSSVALHVTGLTPNTAAQATLTAGTCEAPSASVAALPELTVDASGTGTATGQVLFRGAEVVPLAAVADGEHV
ncbi:MAG: hypothetical protein M3328_03190, partial [Chloroflexota bacterium]|nr:hypothetical protein [Chloroflexota bacterium]